MFGLKQSKLYFATPLYAVQFSCLIFLFCKTIFQSFQNDLYRLAYIEQYLQKNRLINLVQKITNLKNDLFALTNHLSSNFIDTFL